MSFDSFDLIPAHFAHDVCGYEPQGWMSGDDWIMDLPDLISDLLEEWELEPAGRGMNGVTSVVIPVRLVGEDREKAGVSGQAVLKVTFPHHEAEHEPLALQSWNGHGAARLIRAAPSRFAMLIEKLETRDLSRVDIDEACEQIGAILATLRRPPHPRLTPLSDYAARQVHDLRAADPVMPRRYLDQAASLARDLIARPPVEDRLLHTDLHYANVLAAYRTPWLAIDPKPMAGDPGFEIAPALFNRVDELGTGSEIRGNLRRRLEIICERAGIDEERARAWTIVREADNALEAAGDPQGHDRVSLAITIIKAMNN